MRDDDLDNYQEIQDDFANKLKTRLRSHKDWTGNRTLLATPQVITSAPLAGKEDIDGVYSVASKEVSL